MEVPGLNDGGSAGITVLLGVGGGSPIDACKTLSYFHNERYGTFIPHVSMPSHERHLKIKQTLHPRLLFPQL